MACHISVNLSFADNRPTGERSPPNSHPSNFFSKNGWNRGYSGFLQVKTSKKRLVKVCINA
jgi:hypothetical protein